MMTTFRHLLLVVSVIPTVAAAQSFQSLDAIDGLVATSLVGSGLSAGPVDRRLKLASCPEPLGVDPPAFGMVAARCGSLGWRVYARIDEPPATATITPILIKRGDPVQVELIAAGFSLSYSGIADNDARLGERVRVRIDQKASPVVGEAIGAGAVRISGLNEVAKPPLKRVKE
jgi:flagellar basal body P-ring formation protein FlgA